MAKRFLFFAVFIYLGFSMAYSQFQKFEYGIISWYGDDFAGKTTASGDQYDPDKMTAAHKIFPFGTLIEVENLENGRKVTLKINDRGPYAANRVLDVSKKAADDLGFLKKGTVYARITLIKLGDNKVKDILPPSTIASSESNASSAAVSSNEMLQEALAPTNKEPQYKIVITTNMIEVYSTNQLVQTNFVAVPITNVINVEPYEEKIVENNLSDSNQNSFVMDTNSLKPDDQFIMEEPPVITPPVTTPSLTTPIPVLETSKTNEVKTKEPEKVYYTEKEVTPETLLSNETAIQIEDNEPANKRVFKDGVMIEKVGDEENGGSYLVQAGAFHKEFQALKLYDILKKKKYDVFTTENTVKGKKWIRVRIGYFNSISDAKDVFEELKKLKINALVIRARK